MIKLIVSDMDGTLLNNKSELSSSFHKTLKILKEKNILFMAASGRFYNQLCANFEDIEDDIIFAAHNGVIVQSKNSNNTIYESKVEYKDYKKLIDFSREKGLNLMISDKDYAIVENPSQEFLEIFESYGMLFEVVDDLHKLNRDIYKITFYCKDGVNNSLIEEIKENIDSDLDVVLSGHEWVDLMKKGESKGKAIKIIQEAYGISEEETMVFGDHFNDVSMFSRAKFSYAMENAHEDIKNQAKYIAKANSENGVEEAILENII
ncbi:HAD family hydrolase [Clostridium sp. DL1XJH146]